jgi:hypothetical protein
MKHQLSVPILFKALIFATLIPIVFIPLSVWTGINTYIGTNLAIFSILTIVSGSGHVGATLYFFFDPNAREIIKSDNLRLMIAPLLLAIAFSFIMRYAGNQLIYILLTSNIVFLFYHYQKQNFGIISLINRGIPEGSRKFLNCALFFPMVAGTMVYAPLLLQQHSISMIHIKYIATSLYFFGGIFCFAYIVKYREHLRLSALIIVLASNLFFLPLWIFPEDLGTAFTVFATAHGMQYLTIMAFTAAGAGKIIMKLAFLSAVIVGCIVLERLLRNSILGIVLGLTWGHYLIDARIWKMSRPDSRAYVNSRLKFAITK